MYYYNIKLKLNGIKHNKKHISIKYGFLDEVKVALISALGNWAGDAFLYPLETISTRLKALAILSIIHP